MLEGEARDMGAGFVVHTQRQGKRTFYFLPLELALRGKARGLFDICAMKALWGSLRDTIRGIPTL